MDGIIIKTIKNGTYYWKIKTNTERLPKHLCIEDAVEKDCEFVLQVDLVSGYRRFGYYKSVDEYLKTHSFTNINAYEILCRKCKLYFDIEYFDTPDRRFI